MKTPSSQAREHGASEKRARPTGNQGAKGGKSTGSRKPPLHRRLRREEQLAFKAELLENMSHAVIATDAQFRITYWNAAAERLYGYGAEEMLGRLASEALHSEETPEQRAAHIRDLEANTRLQFEVVHHDRQGNALLIQSTIRSLRASDGRILSYIGVNHDITARRQAEQQLRQQAELLELTHDAVLVRDRESRVTFWNRGAEALYGWTRAEAIGQPVQTLLQTQFAQPLDKIEAELERQGHWEGEVVHTTREGRLIQVASRWSLQRDAPGQPVAILQINTDITERKRAETEVRRLNADLEARVSERTVELEAANQKLKTEIAERQRLEDELRQAEQQASDLIRHAPTGIFESDLEGPRVIRVNDALCQMTGYTREEFLAMNPFDVLAPESQARLKERMNKYRAGEAGDELVEYTVRNKDGRERYALMKTRLIFEQGTPSRVFVIAHDITERKRMEDQLREAEQQARDLIQYAPTAIYESELRLPPRLMRVNDAMCQMTGYTREELLAMDPFEVLSPESRERFQARIDRHFAGGQTDPAVTYTFRTKEGRDLHVLLNTRLVYEGGKPVRAFTIAHDITERKQAEMALHEALRAKQESEERLRLLGDHLPESSVYQYMHDPDGRPHFLYISRGVEQINGVQVEDVLRDASTLLGQLAPEDFQRLVEAEAQSAHTLSDFDLEVPMRRPDGQVRWVRLRSRPRRMPDGSTVWDGVQTDITLRKQAEEQLRESEERFRAVLENSLDAAYRRNLQTDRNDYLSPVIEQMTGFSAEEFRQWNLDETLEHIHPDDRAGVQQALDQMLSGETSAAALEYRLRCKDGQYRWLSDKLSILRDASGQPKYWVGTVRDVTEHHQTDERLAAMNRELQRHSAELAIANSDLESFSYSVSHDLRTPLGTVDGLSRLLQQEYGAMLPEQGQRYLDIVQAGTKQMDQLITSLLSLSRLSRQPLRTQPVNMTALVGEALQTLQGAARPGLTITVPDLPEAEADPVLLKQVWVNLLANAVKFTGKNEQAQIEIGCGAHDGEKRAYYVRDNGVGFDMNHVDRLFGVFQRLHGEDEYEGMGIGLATVARIIHRHGGRVWAEGKVGEGATFYFTLG